MPSYQGKFQHRSQDGSVAQQGSCQVQFDGESFVLTPDTGSPLVFDLGDVDSVNAADYEICLSLYTADTVRLQQFGKAYEELTRELLESHRKRMIQCLLLEDMDEVERFTAAFVLEPTNGTTVSGAAEVRLFKSNLAVLPTASQAFQWRLADVDNVRFDSQNYEVVLESLSGWLRINRLAKRTELFHTKVRESIERLRAESAQALHAILPFLKPEQLRCTAGLLREGHSAAIRKLNAIDSRISEALAANAVDKTLKPYFDELMSRTAQASLYAGFKLIRPEDKDLRKAVIEEPGTDDAGNSIGVSSVDKPDADEAKPEVLYWFFFPIAAEGNGAEPGNVLAWEANSTSGRATYFFRLDLADANASRDPGKMADALEREVDRINRVLGMLNFRRRPIYLSDDDLARNATSHRYAIAARRIPDLRQLRTLFLGRAVHSSLEEWKQQVNSILSKAKP